jgi:hypothetical protein
MKVRPILIFILLCMVWVQSLAQSTDPDHPTVLREGQLTITATERDMNYYFTFTALAGEIKITGDGTGNTGFCTISLENIDFQNIGSGYFDISTPMHRAIKRITLSKSQKVILKVKMPKSTNAIMRVRIEGAAQFDGNALASNTEPPPAKEQESEVASGSSRRVIIRLKNGQTIEGKYNGMSITNILNSKLSLTMRGKDLPQFNSDDVKSITIERD